MAVEPWYETLRAQWRPEHIRVLIVDEASPEVHAHAKHEFFYSPEVVAWDPLFRAVCEAVLGGDFPIAKADKSPYLARLRELGAYVIEAVPYPLASYSRGERPHVVARFARDTVNRIAGLAPDGVVIAFTNGYAPLASRVAAAGVPVLQDAMIPSPRGRYRPLFIAGVREAFRRAGVTVPADTPGAPEPARATTASTATGADA